jgi:hypothetical protein
MKAKHTGVNKGIEKPFLTDKPKTSSRHLEVFGG